MWGIGDLDVITTWATIDRCPLLCNSLLIIAHVGSSTTTYFYGYSAFSFCRVSTMKCSILSYSQELRNRDCPIIEKYQSHNTPSLIKNTIFFCVSTVCEPQRWPVRWPINLGGEFEFLHHSGDHSKKKIAIFKTFPKTGRFIVDTLYSYGYSAFSSHSNLFSHSVFQISISVEFPPSCIRRCSAFLSIILVPFWPYNLGIHLQRSLSLLK
jgi:hypothetical protein